MATRKRTSRILAEVHEAARDLHDAGAIDALTMRRFDALCLRCANTRALTSGVSARKPM